jgi:O-acetyl-ADP-ribose deacetylase (regulator of RNase III)
MESLCRSLDIRGGGSGRGFRCVSWQRSAETICQPRVSREGGMKIIYRTGNLLDAEEPVIACGCNARGVMEGGVAGAIRDRYPVTYKMYRNQYDDPEGLRLGDTIWVDCGKHVVVSAITQADYGTDGRRYVDYDAVRAALKDINDSRLWDTNLLAQKPHKVAMPLVGAGLGGGKWSEIAPIIERVMERIQPVVYLIDGKIPA